MYLVFFYGSSLLHTALEIFNSTYYFYKSSSQKPILV